MDRFKSMRGLARPITIVAVCSLFLGSGLFALASDSVSSTGNDLISETFETPTLDLKAAFVGYEYLCDADTPSTDGPLAAGITSGGSANFDLDPNPDGTLSQDYCLVNMGNTAGKLMVAYTNAADTEVGACEPQEASPTEGADTSCSDGDQGELSSIVTSVVQPRSPHTSDSCTGSGTEPHDFSSFQTQGHQIDALLMPGETCRVRILVGHGSLTDQQRLAAQSDRLQWDVVFTLQDPNA